MNNAIFKLKALLSTAVKYSFPVLLGYLAIGMAAGLLLVDAGYPWWLALVMSLVMYAGAGQYLAAGLFASGAGILEAAVIQFVVNARHLAYGFSMLKRFNAAGRYKWYLIYSMTDETFALLSSLPEDSDREHQSRLMFLVSLLDHGYWTFGAVLGAVIGTILPFSMEGIGFALSALFIVLMIEQIRRVKRPGPFVISAVAAVLAVVFLPANVSLLAGLVLALLAVQALAIAAPKKEPPHA